MKDYCIKIRSLTMDEIKNIKKLNYIDNSALTESVLSAIEKKICKMKNAEPSMHEWYTYWIIINDDNKGIGFIGSKGIPDETGKIEIGYSVSSEYRNCGIMTESVKQFIRWAFASEICTRISANVLERNKPSLRVLLKCGFRENDVEDREGYKNFVLDKLK